MIFVTIGTHEQQFDRIINAIDKLVGDNVINEEVFIQSGYSNCDIKHCKYKSMISFEEMNEYVKKARIVITHGGPGSIMLPFKYNKVPIVVPRQSKYNEHVDDHQVAFSRFLKKRNRVLSIENIDELESYILNYDMLVKEIDIENNNNTKEFTERLECIVNSMVI